jgi:hypothetical protein
MKTWVLGVGIARLSYPQGLAMDRSGNFFVSDYNNTIRRVTLDGTVTTIAGTPGAAGSSDGIGSSARFSNPAALALDDKGNLYVADGFNCTVRKVTPAAVVSTVAGTAGACDAFVAGPLPGALNGAGRVAVRAGDLYIGMRHGIAVVRNVP